MDFNTFMFLSQYKQHRNSIEVHSTRWRIQKPTWGGFPRGPKGRVGEGTGGVSPPVGGGSGASPEKILIKWSKMVQSGVQIKPFKLTKTKLHL